MENNVKILLRALNEALYTSEYGIDEESHDALVDLNIMVLGVDESGEIEYRVDATDGFFYYPDGNIREPDMDIYDDEA